MPIPARMRHLLLCFVAVLSIGSGADVPGSGTGRSTGVGLFVLRGHKHRRFERVILHALSVVADEAAADEQDQWRHRRRPCRNASSCTYSSHTRRYALRLSDGLLPAAVVGRRARMQRWCQSIQPSVGNHQGNYMHKIFMARICARCTACPSSFLWTMTCWCRHRHVLLLQSARGPVTADGMVYTLSPRFQLKSLDGCLSMLSSPLQRVAHGASSSTIPDDFIFQTGFDVLNPMPSPVSGKHLSGKRNLN